MPIKQRLRLIFAGPGGILFVAALLLYFPGIWWGIPYATAAPRTLPWGSDELAPMQMVTEVYGVFLSRQPHFNPQYPLFHNLMQLVLVGPYLVYLWLTGGMHTPQALYPYGMTDPLHSLQVTTLLARAVSWMMAAGVVLAAYKTGKALKDELTGRLFGVMTLCLYPMFYYSRTSNVDMGALFWTSLCLLECAYWRRDGLTARRAIRFGVFAALATASKDASWPACLMGGLWAAWPEVAGLVLFKSREKLRALATGFLVSAAVYVTASGLVFRPSRYFAHMRWISGQGFPKTGRAPATLAGYAQLAMDSSQNLVDAMGIAMAVCAIAGIVLCVFRDRRLLGWLLPAAGIAVCVLGPARFVLIRYVLVMAYVLAFFAAFALREAWRSRTLAQAAPVLLVLVGGWSLARGAEVTWQMVRDPRYEASAWFRQHARPGDRVLHFGCPCNLPALEQGVRNVKVADRGSYRFLGTSEDPEFVLLIPYTLFPSEPAHEPNLPDGDYEALKNGSLGYRQVFRIQTPRLLLRRPIPWLNPPVEVFVRNDLAVSRSIEAPRLTAGAR